MLGLERFAEIHRVVDCEFQLERVVRIFIDADSQYVRGAFVLQCVRARNEKRSIGALDVVVIERVGAEMIRARDQREVGFERHTRLSIQDVAVPNFHKRTIPKNSQIFGAAAEISVGRVWRCFSD